MSHIKTGIVMLLCMLLIEYSHGDTTPGEILQLPLKGVIGPASADFVTRTIKKAQDSSPPAAMIIINMDTPGGLDTAMRDIIKSITSSSVPVISYVSPTGARAASAGTYIMYASHIAAMAPGTNLGAATPVQIGAPGFPEPDKKPGKTPGSEQGKDSGKKKEDNDKAKENIKPQNAMQSKIINDAVAYIRSLADLHGRNADWAEKAVRQAASLPAKQALKLKVIDLIAESDADLIKKLGKRRIKIKGQSRQLNTAGLNISKIEPDWRNRLLAVITNPNIAYILMLIGIYGLIFEFSNPGAIVPGVLGAISLLLALYAFQVLPINYAGMGLILLGIALMVAEAFEPSFGILGISGVISFVIGSIILMDTDMPGFGISLSVIITFSLLSALIFVFVIGMAIRARHRPVVSGAEELLGATALVVDDFSGKGRVMIHSEYWNAYSKVPLQKDQKVRISRIEGLVLNVEPLGQTDHIDTNLNDTNEEQQS